MRICDEYNTVQGEGKYVGELSRFIRTTGCNLRCAWKNKDGSITICDTPYSSWKPEIGKDLDLKKTLSELKKKNIKHVVITGGEPSIQKDLQKICTTLSNKGYLVTIETNGTLPIVGAKNTFLSISPKLKSSYASKGREHSIHYKNNNFLSNVKDLIKKYDYQLKFVINTPADIKEVISVVSRLKAGKDKVYLMPQGITSEQLNERNDFILKACFKYGFHYGPRLHIYMWGNKRRT